MLDNDEAGKAVQHRQRQQMPALPRITQEHIRQPFTDMQNNIHLTQFPSAADGVKTAMIPCQHQVEANSFHPRQGPRLGDQVPKNCQPDHPAVKEAHALACERQNGSPPDSFGGPFISRAFDQ